MAEICQIWPAIDRPNGKVRWGRFDRGGRLTEHEHEGGKTYKAADAASQPRQCVHLNASPQFIGKDGLRQVGTITFMRADKTAAK